jgi:hypothetical protein
MLQSHPISPPRLPPAVSIEADAAERIVHGDVELVSWFRALPPRLDAHLTDWAQRDRPEFDHVLSTQRYDLSAATSGLDASVREWLTADIAYLLGRLAQLSEARHLRVWFGAVRSDQCRRFHVDYVRYRLITTYVGPGTEWVPEHALCREALAHPQDCPCDANEAIVRDPSEIRHAMAGEVLVLRGAHHRSGLGAVHRSPPIEGTGRVRVVLIASTVDPS